jgi:hypothetical protein
MSYRVMVIVQDDGDRRLGVDHDGGWRIIDYDVVAEYEGTKDSPPEEAHFLCHSIAKMVRDFIHVAKK